MVAVPALTIRNFVFNTPVLELLKIFGRTLCINRLFPLGWAAVALWPLIVTIAFAALVLATVKIIVDGAVIGIAATMEYYAVMFRGSEIRRQPTAVPSTEPELTGWAPIVQMDAGATGYVVVQLSAKEWAVTHPRQGIVQRGLASRMAANRWLRAKEAAVANKTRSDALPS